MPAKNIRKKKEKITKGDAIKFLGFVSLIIIGFILGSNLGGTKRFFYKLLPVTVSASDSISSKDLSKILNDDKLILINVHSPYEGEIENTDMFIEYDSILANKDRLPKDLDTEIVLYCQTGRMSAEALKTLKGMGYTNVKHLSGGMEAWEKSGESILDLSRIPDEVLPEEGISLPVSWGDLGPRLVSLGVIDKSKFEKAMKLTNEQKDVLEKGSDDSVVINSTNGQFVVDLLWAIGLAQKSLVYEQGPMGQEYKDRVANFASTGGWTLAKGDAVNYLGKYELIPLSKEQQERVGEIAKNVYRPCCGNNTWFPDCNHGMAALAAIEMMVAKGLSDDEIYKNILALNSYWFPDTYLMAATYFGRQGISWSDIDAKEVLGQEFSSAQGAAELYKKVGILPYGGQAGGSCGT